MLKKLWRKLSGKNQGDEINKILIEKIIFESDLWNAFVSSMATIYAIPKERVKEKINRELVTQISEKIVAIKR